MSIEEELAHYKSLMADSVPLSIHQKMIEERDSWKAAWNKQCAATGKNWWEGYYTGLLQGMRQADHWTIPMYQIAARTSVYLKRKFRNSDNRALALNTITKLLK
jgi:hypothetical protein